MTLELAEASDRVNAIVFVALLCDCSGLSSVWRARDSAQRPSPSLNYVCVSNICLKAVYDKIVVVIMQ